MQEYQTLLFGLPLHNNEQKQIEIICSGCKEGVYTGGYGSGALQVKVYSRFREEMSGEKVIKAGLYFIHTKQFVPVVI